MSDRDTIKQALYDAIGWQLGLVDAWPKDSPERAEAAEQVKRYRKILKRRYGDDRSPIDRQLAGTKLVGLDELRTLKNQNK